MTKDPNELQATKAYLVSKYKTSVDNVRKKKNALENAIAEREEIQASMNEIGYDFEVDELEKEK